MASLRWVDESGLTRLEGEIATDTGTTGDVLTQQADGTFAPAPGGGGSQDTVIVVSFTAAEIAGRWSVGDGAAAMELTGLPQGRWMLAAPIVAETLDNNVSLSGNLLAYLPAAASTDVLASGENLQMAAGGAVSAGTYQSSVEVPLEPGNPNKIAPGWLAPGAVAYAAYFGDAAPTTGTASFVILLG